MKRLSVILLATGVVAAGAVTGTALAVGSEAATPARHDSSLVAAAAPARTSAPTTPTAHGSPTAVPTPTMAASPKAAAPGRAPVTRTRAGAIALARVGGGRIAEIEQEVEHGRTAWRVEVLKNGIRYETDVDLATGRITRTTHEQAGDDRGHDSRATDGHPTDDHPGAGNRGDDHPEANDR